MPRVIWSSHDTFQRSRKEGGGLVAPGCLLRKGDGESTVFAVEKMLVTIGNGGRCEEDSCDRLCLVDGLGR
jgi:hypothetical protein